MRRLFHFAVRAAFLVAVVLRLRRRVDARDVLPRARRSSVNWTRWIVAAVVLVALAGIGGLVVMISGIVSIKASAGHWSITEALLQFGKRRSVATHAIWTKVPPLNDPALVLRGAGHYEIGCRPCHGAPDLPQPHIARSMLPPPPYLAQSVHRYDPAELFQLVKHGIKLTGMPAWPSQRRDDEVWAMVAFLRRIPQMKADEYERLAHGPAAASDSGLPLEDLAADRDVGRTIRENCGRCHGAAGLGRGAGAFPRIGGQRRGYLQATLAAFAAGQRHSGIMEPIAAGLNDGQRSAIADYYAALELPVGAAPPLHSATADGERIATRGVPEQDIPACITCHGPGQPRSNPNYPIIAGQYPGYLALQLELFKRDNRGGTPYRNVMHQVAQRLSAEQIAAVTQYFGSLPWRGGGDSQPSARVRPTGPSDEAPSRSRSR